MIYIAIAAIVILIIILAKNSKKSVTANMSNLANAGKVVAYIQLQEKLITDIGTHKFGSDNDNLGLYAAAGINLIFGEALNEQHQKLDLESLKKYVNAWIGSNSNLLEIVVQSIRTLHTVHYARKGTISSKGMEILETYGSKYPDAPTQENLNELVNTAIDKLPTEEQASIRNTYHISR